MSRQDRPRLALGMNSVLGLLAAGLVMGCSSAPAENKATDTPCPAGYTACGGQCLDLTANAQNCGTCGTTCAAGQQCTAGTCQCQGGLTSCGGQCVDTRGDGANCDRCGTACSTGQVCAAGLCSGSGCPAGTLQCGTSCVNAATDPLNCGSCATTCPAPMTCAGGACACPAGTSSCGGVCVDTASDLNNCGVCGTVCTGGATCSGGACVGGSGGTGGLGTGGAGTGGAGATGGDAMGGAATGGDGTGGVATGGDGTGGVGTGGVLVNPACPGDAAMAYQGAPGAVPGTIEAEDFDSGGFSDSSAGNEGGAYRTDVDVDIKALGAGHAIGWMTAGEWLEYTVNVPVAGDYTLSVQAGAVDAGRTLEFSQCGTSLLGPVAVPQIAAWGEMSTTTAGTVRLEAGLQVIRVTVGASDFIDFDSFTFATGSAGTGGAGTGGAPTGGVSTGGVSTGGASTGGVDATGGTGGVVTPWPPSATFSNPVLWEDLADIDVIRVGDIYYYTASNMHYSPGAPILQSYDLVNWEYAGHAIPVLDFSAKYDMNGARAYVKGTWASTLNYRESNSTFYWIGCIEFGRTYVYTAAAVAGPWQKHPAINTCYYDAGLLIDDDDTMYVAYGATTINVAQLSADGLSEVSRQEVFTSPSSVGTLEGARFYKINGSYYIFLTRPANAQYILKASSPWGPYTMQPLLSNLGAPIAGGGVPHQGGLVQTQNGDWYYMAFVDSFPGGRVPVLAPITWTADGWPQLQLVNGAWGASYPYPNVPAPPREMKSHTGREVFAGSSLAPEWEWNHNPDNARWSLSEGLRLQTATVTNDLFSARNTLTHRILGPQSTATIELDYSGMSDGDVTGLAMFRNSSAWIGLKKAGGATRVVMVNGLTMDSSWNTTGTGTEVASAAVSGGTIWLRVAADIRPGANRQAVFSYSTDGTTFTTLGSPYVLDNTWQFFMGYRYAIFNYATQSLGGVVTVPWFEVTAP